ncbi:MAG: cell division protein FtsA [Pseudomonadota bacterium]|nr:cell division protein FtsA [Pseudomonadota bacterium]
MLDVAGVDDRPSRKLSRRALSDVIQPRVEELYELIQAELRRAGFEEVLSSGIVLTGGTSVMPGMIELGEEIFHMPVRLGIPKYTGALADVIQSPRFATAFGLLLEAQAQHKRGQKVHETRNVKQVFGRMKSWFEKNF